MTQPNSKKTADLKSALSQLENVLEEYLVKKAPFQIPQNIKEIIVSLAPWLSLIGVVLAVPSILVLFGLGTAMMPLGYMMGGLRYGATFSISMIFTVIILLLEAIAIPGLFKKARAGWNFMYYATLVGVVQNLIVFNIGGLIIGSLIGFYILFQVKELYK